ncbi:MAG: hypothetical protein B5M48_00710 [Candidatus Omnitrophica bacterium 4484_213]|nr:MAG: hypothetical protein B5M48_00710 [Candidatus Omnitrophica bacterium 4484_213]
MTNSQKDFLLKEIKGKVLFDEPLAKHTTLGVGGPAEAWVEPTDIPSLTKLVKFSIDEKIPLFAIGRGSNLLVRDDGVKGIVVRLNSPVFTYVKREGQSLRCGGGAEVGEALKVARDNGLSGLEFVVGVPATVGGAIKTNLSVSYPFKRGIKEVLDHVKMLDGEKKEKDFPHIIIEAKFSLQRADKEAIAKKMDDFIAYRQRTQELTLSSAGCIFKNPEGRKGAGWLIEQCGLKGKRIGGAEISSRHSNFIINHNQKAKAENVLALIKIMRKEVQKRFNIHLKLEVEIWG